jgi:hypothetical protein
VLVLVTFKDDNSAASTEMQGGQHETNTTGPICKRKSTTLPVTLILAARDHSRSTVSPESKPLRPAGEKLSQVLIEIYAPIDWAGDEAVS